MKGLNNQPCLGPCLPKNTITLHPIYLFPITDKDDNPYCPTLQWTDDKGNRRDHDICEEDKTNKKNPLNAQLLYAIPNFGFDCGYFLKNYYNINSFEGTLDWLYSENNNLNTKLRVMNCAWEIFGIEKDSNININDQLIDFYIEVISKIWIYDIYDIVYNLISVNGKNIYFKKSNDDKKIYKVEKVNFFLDKFGTKSIIYTILQEFVQINKSKWKNIKNYNNELKKYYIDYVVGKIKVILK